MESYTSSSYCHTRMVCSQVQFAAFLAFKAVYQRLIIRLTFCKTLHISGSILKSLWDQTVVSYRTAVDLKNELRTNEITKIQSFRLNFECTSYQ